MAQSSAIGMVILRHGLFFSEDCWKMSKSLSLSCNYQLYWVIKRWSFNPIFIFGVWTLLKNMVKSLSKHSAASEVTDKAVYKGLWKSNSPKRVNILIWVMVFRTLNCSSVLQRKLPSHYLSPSICPLCPVASEDLHLFSDYCFYGLLEETILYFSRPVVFWRFIQGQHYSDFSWSFLAASVSIALVKCG